MKTCKVCNKKKKLTEFHACKVSKDGRRSTCKLCRNSKQREYYSENKEEILEKNKGNHKKYLKDRSLRGQKRGERWDRNHPEKASKYRKDWRLKNKLKIKAHNLLNKAIKDGSVVRGKCEVCGVKEVHGHHEDYNKPLLVNWLCEKHHKEVHKKYKPETKEGKNGKEKF